LIGQLQIKLPRDLARKLIVISMKLATGYCSPYAARELEEAIDAVPDRERKAFEKEWKMVREHKHWPRMPCEDEDRQPASRPPRYIRKRPSTEPDWPATCDGDVRDSMRTCSVQ
jgi:hypothetical protein